MTLSIGPRAEVDNYRFGAWKRAHVSARLLRLAQRYHAWQLA